MLHLWDDRSLGCSSFGILTLQCRRYSHSSRIHDLPIWPILADRTHIFCENDLYEQWQKAKIARAKHTHEKTAKESTRESLADGLSHFGRPHMFTLHLKSSMQFSFFRAVYAVCGTTCWLTISTQIICIW